MGAGKGPDVGIKQRKRGAATGAAGHGLDEAAQGEPNCYSPKPPKACQCRLAPRPFDHR